MAQKNSNVIGIAVLVIALAGIGYWKFTQRPATKETTLSKPDTVIPIDTNRTNNNGALVFVAGYLSDRQLEAMKKNHQFTTDYYKKKGLDFEFLYTAPDPARVVMIEPDWHFSFSTGGITITQHFNGTKMRPILWNQNCEYSVQVAVAKDSPANKPADLAGKKILISTHGYLSPIQLLAIHQWNLDKATLFMTSDMRVAYSALQSRRVDAILSDAILSPDSELNHVFGRIPNDFIKILGSTKTGTPCRVINAATKTDQAKVDLLLKIIKEDDGKKPGEEIPMFFTRMFPVKEGEFEEVVKKFDMKVLAKYKDLPKYFDPNAEVPASPSAAQ